MDKLYIAACDDEPEILDVFARLIRECFAYHNIQVTVDKYNDPIALIKGIKSRSYDLLFLDIDMPHVDGITLAKGIRDAGIRIDIIYVSNKEELVFKVFDIQPYGFIRKSRFFEEIAGVVRSYIKSRDTADKRRLVIEQKSGDILSLDLNKVLYFEGEGKNQKAYLFMNDSPLQIRSSMKELEAKLDDKGFIRVHKGYLVNYQFIDSIKNNTVFLSNGFSIPISRRNVNDVKLRYLTLMK